MKRSRLFFAIFILLCISQTADADSFVAVDHQRQTIYHSPQRPGYTCWVNAWVMPGDAIMVPERNFSRAEVVQLLIAGAGLILSGVAITLAATQ